MPPQTLRPYQGRGRVEVFRAWGEGARKVLAIAPTGSGKTSLFGFIIAQLARAGRRAVVLVHRRELATQACNRLRDFDVAFGLIMHGEEPRPYAPVQVASVQTLVRRQAPPADLVVCDEAHLSTAQTWQKVLEQYPAARILGVTATPWRLSGKPLASLYDQTVVIATPRELREQGHLAPYVGFSYKTPDLSGVKTTAGEYNERESAEVMRAPDIVDTVVEEYAKHARHLSAVVFAVTVEHSRDLTSRFKAAGIVAEHLDGQTPLEERKAILRRVEAGRTMVLCNVGVAVEGLDIPRLKCCILARPTKSLSRAIQMMGRIRRPWGECACGAGFPAPPEVVACPRCGGPEFSRVTARIHDHAFTIRQHGLPDDDRDYSLDARPEKPPSLRTCEECLALYSGPRCPACDHENAPQGGGDREIEVAKDGEQFEFSSEHQGEGSPIYRKPVEIRWDKPGRKVEGRFVRTWTEESQFGPLKTYLYKGARRDYRFHGTSHLNQLLADQQREGLLTRITYERDRALPNGRWRKLFRVEVDDNA